MSKKLRPGRIAEGWKNTIFNNETTSSTDRLEVCKSCEHLKAKVACGICGCEVHAKTKVIDEHCPINKWKDVKFLESEGVALICLEPDKAVVELENSSVGFVVRFLNPLNPANKEEGTVHLKIVNDRADVKTNPKELDLTNVKMKVGCGACTKIIGEIPKTVEEGKNFDFKVAYDMSAKGTFNKSVSFISKQSMFKIRLTGEVI